MQLISLLETIIIISILYTLYKAKHPKEQPHKEHQQREKFKYELSDAIEKVLTTYDQSGIRLPLDIIEELDYLNLTSEAEITAYIESQRIHWKYECMKKLFKGGSK